MTLLYPSSTLFPGSTVFPQAAGAAMMSTTPTLTAGASLATLKVAQTDWVHAKSAGTSFSIAIPTPTAGHSLIFTSAGGAISTPAGFTRALGAPYGGGAQDVSVWLKTATGSETSISVTLNGSGDNVGGTIMEFSGALTYAAGSNNGSGTTISSAGDYQVATGAATVTNPSLVIAVWSVNQSSAFSQSNQFQRMGPAGAIVRSAGTQDASGSPAIFAVGIADVDAGHQYPQQASAGSYAATSVYQGASPGTAFACQAIFTKVSALPVVSWPNAIVKENSLPGTSNANWYLNTAGTDSSIAGFPTAPSVQPGGTIGFKVGCAFAFRAEIYRLGFYGHDGFGARNVLGNQGGYLTGTVVSQPTPVVDGTLGSTSCAAWTTNVSWSVPADAAPGVYYVIFRRTDAGNTSKAASTHFVVRETSPAGKIAVVIPDLTHHAYNVWGAITDHGDLASGTWTGRSLYQAGSDGSASSIAHRAYAVCLDRPYSTQSTQAVTYLFDSEFGWIQFAEAQGYNLTYLSDMDLENNSTLLNSVAMVCPIGHHEYWTANIYSAFQNATAAGVNMFWYSANTGGWRVRFDVADTGKRVATCYKDGITRDNSPGWTGTGYDPVSPTGTWRDAGATNGVANPDRRLENSLTGQHFVASGPLAAAMQISASVKTKPIWRNSPNVQALASGTHITDISNSIGYELDSADGASGQPANLTVVASTSIAVTAGANAAGTVYATSTTYNATWTLYRDPAAGALVFNVGNWRAWWSVARWQGSSPATNVSIDVQNALLAILYDLGAVPQTLTALQPGVDTAPTDPATGAPTAGNSAVAVAYGLTVPTTVSGSAALSATGTLSPTTTNVVAGTAALSATGTLGAGGVTIDQGVATLSTTGTLGATATFTGAGVTAISAEGAVSAGAVATISASTAMSCAPVVTAGAVAVLGTGTALSTTPAVAAVPTITTTDSAALATTPALTATATQGEFGVVGMMATGTLNAAAVQAAISSVSLSTTANVTAAALDTTTGTIALACTPAVASTSFVTTTAVVALVCVPTTGASAGYIGLAASAVSTEGVVTVGAVTVTNAVVALAATANLAASSAYLAVAAVPLAATGALGVSAITATTAVVALATEPTMIVSGLRLGIASVALGMISTLTVFAIQATGGVVALAVTATITATATITTGGAAVLGAEPVVAANAVLGVVNLAAEGVLFTDVFGGAFVVDLSVTAALLAGVSLGLTGMTDLAATGTLGASVAIVQAGAVALASITVLGVGVLLLAPGVVSLTSQPILVSVVARTATGVIALSTTGSLFSRSTDLLLNSTPALVVLATRIPHGVVALDSAGELIVVAQSTTRAIVVLASTPALTADTVQGRHTAAPLAATGTLVATASQTAAAALICTATLNVAASQGFDTHVILMRTFATLTMDATHIAPGAVTLATIAALTAGAVRVDVGATTLTAIGLLISAVQYAQYNPVMMQTVGTLHAGSFVTRPRWPYLLGLLPDRWVFEILETVGGED